MKTNFSKFYIDFLITARRKPTLFLSVWSSISALLGLSLIAVGLAPAIVLGEDTADVVITASTPEPIIIDENRVDEAINSIVSVTSAPTRIIIDSIGVDTSIENPESADISVLDEALTRGAVHYPGSGNLEDTSNLFLFGHSSRLPVVKNQAYKAFNDVEKLSPGDLIRVQSDTKEYHYRVTSVREVKAEDAWVRFDTSEKQLTLSTCNNFGSKQDRFVVEADYIGSFTLGA